VFDQPDGSSVIYRASWQKVKILAAFCLVLSLLILLTGIRLSDWTLFAFGLSPVAYLYAVRLRLRASVDDERIRYRGWFSTRNVEWRDITAVVQSCNLPYPRGRYYGPSCYEVRTQNQRFMINVMWFPPEFSRTFRDEARRRKLFTPLKAL
jgi:hypothetical protein